MKDKLSAYFAILLLFVFFLPNASNCQKSINGKYCCFYMNNNEKQVVDCIIFHDNNEFEYSYYPFEFKYGTGYYSLVKDTLILQFDSTYNNSGSEYFINENTATFNDSIKITLRIFNDKDITGQILSISRKALSTAKDSIAASFSNINNDSLLVFTLKKQPMPFVVSVYTIGTNPLCFEIPGEKSSDVSCYLRNSHVEKINGERYVYKVVKFRKKKIILKTIISDDNRIYELQRELSIHIR